MHTSPARRDGFNSIEIVILLVILTMMGTVFVPIISSTRSRMRAITSEANLAFIAQASAAYALDNNDRIYSFTWREGETHINLGNGNLVTMSDDPYAAARQAQNILYRATGRLTGKGKILVPMSRNTYRRYTHLVLADYLGGIVSDPVWADPADADLLRWQFEQPTNLEEYRNSGVPYANGIPDQVGYDADANWARNEIRQLWPFASSYQAVPHAWQPDYGPQYSPVEDTPHLFIGSSGIEHGERRHHQVRFPALKVHLFEEFDREQIGTPYFAYDHAAPAKLMFDGSVNNLQSGFARSSVSPRDYNEGEKVVWHQKYIPLDTFPIPLSGLGEQTELNMRYRWTLGGLSGIDYPQLFTPTSRR